MTVGKASDSSPASPTSIGEVAQSIETNSSNAFHSETKQDTSHSNLSSSLDDPTIAKGISDDSHACHEVQDENQKREGSTSVSLTEKTCTLSNLTDEKKVQPVKYKYSIETLLALRSKMLQNTEKKTFLPLTFQPRNVETAVSTSDTVTESPFPYGREDDSYTVRKQRNSEWTEEGESFFHINPESSSRSRASELQEHPPRRGEVTRNRPETQDKRSEKWNRSLHSFKKMNWRANRTSLEQTETISKTEEESLENKESEVVDVSLQPTLQMASETETKDNASLIAGKNPWSSLEMARHSIDHSKTSDSIQEISRKWSGAADESQRLSEKVREQKSVINKSLPSELYNYPIDTLINESLKYQKLHQQESIGLHGGISCDSSTKSHGFPINNSRQEWPSQQRARNFQAIIQRCYANMGHSSLDPSSSFQDPILPDMKHMRQQLTPDALSINELSSSHTEKTLAVTKVHNNIRDSVNSDQEQDDKSGFWENLPILRQNPSSGVPSIIKDKSKKINLFNLDNLVSKTSEPPILETSGSFFRNVYPSEDVLLPPVRHMQRVGSLESTPLPHLDRLHINKVPLNETSYPVSSQTVPATHHVESAIAISRPLPGENQEQPVLEHNLKMSYDGKPDSTIVSSEKKVMSHSSLNVGFPFGDVPPPGHSLPRNPVTSLPVIPPHMSSTSRDDTESVATMQGADWRVVGPTFADPCAPLKQQGVSLRPGHGNEAFELMNSSDSHGRPVNHVLNNMSQIRYYKMAMPHQQEPAVVLPQYRSAAAPSTFFDMRIWYYKDLKGSVQGPFTSNQMHRWWQSSQLPPHLLIRYDRNVPWVELTSAFPRGEEPFKSFPVKLPGLLNNNTSNTFMEQSDEHLIQTNADKTSVHQPRVEEAESEMKASSIGNPILAVSADNSISKAAMTEYRLKEDKRLMESDLDPVSSVQPLQVLSDKSLEGFDATQVQETNTSTQSSSRIPPSSTIGTESQIEKLLKPHAQTADSLSFVVPQSKQVAPDASLASFSNQVATQFELVGTSEFEIYKSKRDKKKNKNMQSPVSTQSVVETTKDAAQMTIQLKKLLHIGVKQPDQLEETPNAYNINPKSRPSSGNGLSSAKAGSVSAWSMASDISEIQSFSEIISFEEKLALQQKQVDPIPRSSSANNNEKAKVWNPETLVQQSKAATVSSEDFPQLDEAKGSFGKNENKVRYIGKNASKGSKKTMRQVVDDHAESADTQVSRPYNAWLENAYPWPGSQGKVVKGKVKAKRENSSSFCNNGLTGSRQLSSQDFPYLMKNPTGP